MLSAVVLILITSQLLDTYLLDLGIWRYKFLVNSLSAFPYPVLYFFLDGFAPGIGKSSVDPADERDDEVSMTLAVGCKSVVGSVGALVIFIYPLYLNAIGMIICK